MAAAALTLTAATSAGASITRAGWTLPRHAVGCYQRPTPPVCLIRYWVRRTWHAEDAHRLARRPYSGAAEHSSSLAYQLWTRLVWRARYRRVAALPIPSAGPTGSVLADLMCIHRGEGAMTSVNPVGPYYGGWQMDASFERTYGPEFVARYGTADHWPAHDQLIAAYRGYLERGWAPWPATSRACGL